MSIGEVISAGSLAAPLMEREAEQQVLRDAAAAARRQHGSLVVLTAPAGQGRSSLLRLAAEEAASTGLNVLQGRASLGRLTLDLSYEVATQLLEPAWREADASTRQLLLEGAARPVEGLLAPGAGSQTAGADPQPSTMTRALVRFTANLVTAPFCAPGLALIVDDAHLADHASLRYLTLLASRVAHLPVAIIISYAAGEELGREELFAELRHAASHVLSPPPLSDAGIGELTLASLGRPAPTAAAALSYLSAGNPLLASELLAAALESGERLERSLGQALESVPPRIQEWALRRLMRLGGDAERLARTVSLFEDGLTLIGAQQLTRTPLQRAAEAADLLARTGLIASGLPLRFTQPVLQRAVYQGLPPIERAQLHAQAAELLMRSGAASEEVTPHVMAGPVAVTPGAAAVLRQSARLAAREGTHARAVQLLERALEEQPERDERVELLAELSATEDALGLPTALDRLAEARSLTTHLDRRGELALTLGRMLYRGARYLEAATVVDEELRATQSDHQHVVRELLAVYVSSAALVEGLSDQALERREQMLDALVAPSRLQRAAIAHTAIHDSLSGAPVASVRQLSDLAWGNGALLQDGVEGRGWPMLCGALLLADELERVEEICQAVSAQSSGSDELAHAAVACFRAWVSLGQGQLQQAQREAAKALRAPIDASHGFVLTAPAVVGLCHVERGAFEQAEGVLGVLERQPLKDLLRRPLALVLELRLRMAQHRPQQALSLARELADLAHSEPALDGGAAVPWRSSLALAHLALGEREQAAHLAHEDLEEARRSGATSPLLRSLRTAGLVTGGSRGIALLREAAEGELTGTPRLEHLRALVDLGAALRRANRRTEAREPLRQAYDLAHRAGASILAARAQTELIATGAKPRRSALKGPESLTPNQLRVAELAAQGLSTRQIADASFVTPKTVEFHLREIYRKLEVGSRAELIRVMADCAASTRD